MSKKPSAYDTTRTINTSTGGRGYKIENMFGVATDLKKLCYKCKKHKHTAGGSYLVISKKQRLFTCKDCGE